jgi:hypothetical protein
MTQTAVIAVLAVFGAWLLTLSVLFAAVVRHLGTVQATVLGMAAGKPFDFASDGPELTGELPGTVRDLLVEHGVAPDTDAVVLSLSTGCDPCFERTEEFSRSPAAENARLVVLATGHDSDRLAQLRAMLEPLSLAFVTDPAALDAAKTLAIKSTPFAFRISAGRVVDKTYVASAADLQAIVEHLPTGPRSTARTTEEPSHA